MFQFGYLTPKQRHFWDLRQRGATESEISRSARITRQAVNKIMDTVDSKVAKALVEAANVNRLEIAQIDPIKGYISGFSPQFRVKVFITFSAVNGITVWYDHEGECEYACVHRPITCKEILFREASDRAITLPENKDKMPLSALANFIFSRIEER